MRNLYSILGGRKQFNGYLGAALITTYAVWTHADFVAYAAALATMLGLTQFSVALEENRREADSNASR